MLRHQPRRWARLVHTASNRAKLVGPPDPISHIRPVIYDDAPPPPSPTVLRHPYSLSEFDTRKPLADNTADELQWKIERQQLDDLSQNFWLDSNARFEAGKQAILDGLPVTATALDSETALTEFYRQWVMQEHARTEAFTREWRAKNIKEIILAARVAYRRTSQNFWKALHLPPPA